MYAVFVDDGFDSLYNTKEEAKIVAQGFRCQGQHACIHKLTREDKEMIGINEN